MRVSPRTLPGAGPAGTARPAAAAPRGGCPGDAQGEAAEPPAPGGRSRRAAARSASGVTLGTARLAPASVAALRGREGPGTAGTARGRSHAAAL